MSDLATLKTLLEALQNAKEGSRELSDRCLEATNYTRPPIWDGMSAADFAAAFGNLYPDPTSLVDDALDCMVPEGWYYEVMTNSHFPNSAVKAFLNEGGIGLHRKEYEAIAATEPLARSAVCIKQLIGECDD